MEKPWTLEINEVARQLKTDISTGLTEQEAKYRLSTYGYNKLVERKKKHPVFLFFDQFKSFIIWVLIIAAIIAGFLKEWIDTFAIIGIVILNSILGFFQEFRAEKALEALKKLFTLYSKVLREGQLKTIPSTMLVPGDIIEIEAGDNIPADCRVIWHTTNFTVQEASLTGESSPVIKTNIALDEPDAIIAERANMVYMGTNVASGRARCIVINTGMNTELGKITEMIEEATYEKTPLQKKLENFGRILVYICFFIVGIIFLLEWLRGGKLIDVFLTAVSLAVAAIPEGLPAVVTIGLALGVQKMAKRNVLIRKLPSVETLGCATTICTDKTGTLTKNEMTVTRIYADKKIFSITGIGYTIKGKFLSDEKEIEPGSFHSLKKSLICAVVCNGARININDQSITTAGDPTEIALLVAAAKGGIFRDEIEKQYEMIDEIPFDSERKRMTVIAKKHNDLYAFIKGAPDILLDLCSFIEENQTIKPLDDSMKKEITQIIEDFSKQSLRVLATGYRQIEPGTQITEKNIERNIILTGLFAMIDPPREEAKIAIKKCKKAGIKVKMVTGDHKLSAVAIAKQLSLVENEQDVITGQEIEKIGIEQFKKMASRISVYARVSPHHKLMIVKALKENNEIVAMTGDGVNDAPAVKEANIGIAMGITGTDVTKEVSDMVITDDNFVSIVAAVEEGRGIYENIRKFVYFLLSTNTGEIMVMFFSALLNMPVPLVPIQILWINIATDGLPALALGVDPVSPEIMEKPPRKPDEPILNWKLGRMIIFQGFVISVCVLAIFAYALFVKETSMVKARTMAFFVLACTQLFHSFNCRSEKHSIFHLKFTSNMKLVHANILSLITLVAIIYVPVTRIIFKTEILQYQELLLVIMVSSIPLWLTEFIKFVMRKNESKVSVQGEK